MVNKGLEKKVDCPGIKKPLFGKPYCILTGEVCNQYHRFKRCDIYSKYISTDALKYGKN